MKYPSTRFKNMHLALKELERFIRDGRLVQTGRPLNRFGGLLPREMIANWLVCAVLNDDAKAERFAFHGSHEFKSDGIIVDTETGHDFPTEHVFVPKVRPGAESDVGTLILEMINHKQRKGAAYASGKTLIVFVNAGSGEWFSNRVARMLPTPLDFDSVWVVARQPIVSGKYVYAVTCLDLSSGNAPVRLVRIAPGFDSWSVETEQ